MTDAKAKIFALVPNHQTHFSRAAMDMTFKPQRLASDLDKFALYASNGDLPVDGHHFWYRLVQDKLLVACPDLFRLASEHFGKRIEFDPHITFTAMIDKFMDIVLAVQTEIKTSLIGEKRARTDSISNPAKAKVPKVAPKTKGTNAKWKKDDFDLARAVGMCFGCGKLYPAGKKGQRYSQAHTCNKQFVKGVVTDEFKAGLAPWRKLADDGKTKAEIEAAADGKRSKRA
jgi:hypothetical protein